VRRCEEDERAILMELEKLQAIEEAERIIKEAGV